MVMKNVAHVLFGYPVRRIDTEEKEKTEKVKPEKIKPEKVKLEKAKPEKIKNEKPVAVALKKERVAPVPVLLEDTLVTDDKELAAEALLTVIENGEVKGTLADGIPLPVAALKKTSVPENIAIDLAEPAPVPVAAAVPEAPAQKKEDDMLSSLFKQEAEKKNSTLDILIAALPSVNMEDLVNEAREIKSMLYARQSNKTAAENP